MTLKSDLQHTVSPCLSSNNVISKNILNLRHIVEDTHVVLSISAISLILNVGCVYLQKYEPQHLRVHEKNRVMVGKGTYVNSVKTRYKSIFVKLIECYAEWQSVFSSLFILEKGPLPSLCYFGES